MNKKLPNSIERIIEKAEKGDLSASIQLIDMFNEGNGVDIDKNKSEYFKGLAIKHMSNKPFTISNISLSNFRGFEKINIPLDKSITIIIGNNGSGKSSILDAIQKCMSHLLSRLTTRSYNGDLIEQNEIKKGTNSSTVNAKFCIDDTEFPMELAQSRAISDEKLKGNYSGINLLCSLLRDANNSDISFSLPLMASYTVDRSTDVSTKDISESEELINIQIWDKAKAYNKSLSGKADFKIFFRWFKEISENIELNEGEINNINSIIKEKELLLKNPLFESLLSESSKSEHISNFINETKNEIAILKLKLNTDANKNIKLLNCIKDAIYEFIPEFNNLRVSRDPLDLLVQKNDLELSVLQLSQGEKTILALVADIARRLVLLNPKSDNPLNGNGIVLIDEIDLHLHPEWQQKIIDRLTKTFKGIQFILTTHSPQVCHTVDSSNIFLIRDCKLYKSPKGTRGAVSSWVLKNLFAVDERPPTDKYTKMLREYTDMVYSDKFNEPRTIQLAVELAEHFGADYEDLVRLNLHIENRKWELEDEEN